MNILVVEPGYAPYEKEINGLHEMQATAGGPIQALYPFDEKVAVICNDEGLISGLPFNRSIEGGYDGVFGTFFVCGLGEETFCSLTQAQMETYKRKFRHAEILLGTKDGSPITLKFPAPQKGTKKPNERGSKEPER